MKGFRQFTLVVLLLGCLLRATLTAQAGQGVHFKVTLDPALDSGPVSGRMIVFMTANPTPMPVLEPSILDLKQVWACAQEVSHLSPGGSMELDPDTLSFPAKFTQAPVANYQIMALLDENHSYAGAGGGPGDLFSPVARISDLHPDRPQVVELLLSQRAPERPPLRDTGSRKLIIYKSDLLSAFWGRPVEMQAGVVLPPSYGNSASQKYPAVYQIHGFGSSHAEAWNNGAACCGPAPAEFLREMAATNWPEMVYVYLDASCPMGHHVFADSVNNGPWGRALVEEFIPHLERTFRLEAKPASRLLSGHSSGGWSALWVQVTHPDFFGGVWATAPDPVDFRNWTGPDLTKFPPENFYRKPDGGPRWLIRMSGRDTVKVEEFARWENVLGDYGGQFASFEAVFSPRGEDGRPQRMFNRETGEIDPVVQKAWSRFDISRLLRENWSTLGPKLNGKLHIIVGTKDTIHLEESVYLLRDNLKELGGDANFTILDGRDHFNLYEGGLARAMALDMYAVAHPKEPAK